MQTRFLLGPAGAGKTFRCLAEIRAALAAAPEGPPLLLIAPKQTTYQLERELLADGSLKGYTRLHILSFERLAKFIFERLRKSPPRMLDEQGRLMVLRSLLAKKRDELRLFRASARLTGFAQHLSLVLRELQRHQLTPDALERLAEDVNAVESLSSKLHDLAMLLRDYLGWLHAHQLQDADCVLDIATQTLREGGRIEIGGLWLDGFHALSPQELGMLAEILPHSAAATITFCLDRVPKERVSWLSSWSSVRNTYEQCRQRIAGLPQCVITDELLPRARKQNRFENNAALRHLEAHWVSPKPFEETASAPASELVKKSIRVATCADAEAEAVLAAHEILRFVRAGGRYREAAVLARDLQSYHEPLVNVFNRYQIPFFLDRRESVSHHPLAELSRNALRTVTYWWERADWFAALKTGLIPVSDAAIDRLENAALERGWRGNVWHEKLFIKDDPGLTRDLEATREKIIKPFQKLAARLGQKEPGSRGQKSSAKPTGAELAAAMREFWESFKVADTLQQWSETEAAPNPIHLTVWEQMNAWLDNVELAFPTEPLPLREWLPILEAGLAGLSVGVIPPALDQVSIGAIDRSRNADIRLALVLGINEGIFPAPPRGSVLLTDADRVALEKEGITLTTARQQLSQERFFGYLAFTRARERLVLTASAGDVAGKPLNPSPFLAQFKQLFPTLEFENVPRARDWRQSEHASELIVPLLLNQASPNRVAELSRLDDLPALADLRASLQHLTLVSPGETLLPKFAEGLYGQILRTSVSRMEQFAACPFKFFVHSGLRAEERKVFELDIRDQGNFQHEALASFHEELRGENRRWRDVTPEDARERIGKIADGMLGSFRDGLLEASEEGKFTARILVESLKDFVETLVGWMRGQYAFDPAAVELPFGEGMFPPWDLDLGGGHRLHLHGRIDRIDILKDENGETALCAVVDYKSSQKKLDALLMEHGLQLQLPGYLNVLRHWPDPRSHFGVARLIPAGVFYVNLRGKYDRGENRDEILAGVEAARKLAYRHAGRFDAEQLAHFDQRKNVSEGDQFNYRLKQDGSIHGGSHEVMTPEKFLAMLDGVETALKKMGAAIYAGDTRVDPFRRGNVTACDQCDYRSICRIDPWTHQYRVLRKASEDGDE
ncbi:MAG TPA: PD-(D/E)XK nuclease family protein [Verrucomicrobiae bacterium]|jgi:ATP-dependent helicase/nuclease subunit B|nr:PD-(D/E)XK nuclease family protein [Verrucomicrobiae bacterium]